MILDNLVKTLSSAGVIDEDRVLWLQSIGTIPQYQRSILLCVLNQLTPVDIHYLTKNLKDKTIAFNQKRPEKLKRVFAEEKIYIAGN